MAKIDITKTELVWPEKYNYDGTINKGSQVSLPFQVIETVNESSASREARKTPKQTSLFEVYEGKEGDTFEEGWRNKIIWGDNILVMGSLLEKFAGKIDLIYIDPPFATGANFSFITEIGESGDEVFKEQSIIEELAYRDTWGNGIQSYLSMIFPRLELMRTLLSDSGNIIVHVDYRLTSQIRLLLEECFGIDNFRNEIIWHYHSGGIPQDFFPRKHDTLLWYCKGKSPYFSPKDASVPRNECMECGSVLDKWNNLKKHVDEDGRVYRTIKSAGKVYVYYDDEPTLVPDVWLGINHLQQKDPERTGYLTQKPEKLLQRIIASLSEKGGLIADFFCGSGTSLVVAEKLGRRWIGCDLGRWSIHVTRKRLLGIENCKPFEVLNLGKYERQYWQGVTFGDAENKAITEQALYEYLAFILKLYGAQPVAGMANLHGKKGKALVHIGAVEAPVTIIEINLAIDECSKIKQSELHVLGWEWEMGLYDLMVEAAKKKGVKLLLLQIPREVMEQQAAAKGDVRFFELAYLAAEIKQPKKNTLQVTLKEFVIPNTELIPEEVRTKIKKWSDYIDYWAVDWDFREDTFMQGWVAYRTRKERKLTLTSDQHTYEKPGKYRILVKVIDIFGNDTSQAFDVEVK